MKHENSDKTRVRFRILTQFALKIHMCIKVPFINCRVFKRLLHLFYLITFKLSSGMGK